MDKTKNHKKLIINFIKIIFSFAFMSFILYYFFGKNSDSLQRDLLEVKNSGGLKYIILSMIFGGWAYIIRGLRWTFLIDALGYKTSKINSVSAVSIGYLTNLFIPRAGEISRCTSLKKSDDIPIDKLFGTILIERIIDFAFLLFFILLSVILKSGDFIKSYNEYQNLEDTESSNIKFIILGVLVLIVILIYLFKKKIKQLPFYKKVSDFIDGFKEGFKSIKKMQNKSIFWIHTLSIWIMYFLMTYICFQSIPETNDLDISDGLFLLVLGGIGMIIPTPGGIGSYHIIVMIGLVALQIPGGVMNINPYDEYNPAMLFPFIVHTAQTFVAIIMGSIGLLLLFMKTKE